MKKFILFFFAMVMFAANAMARDVVFDISQVKGNSYMGEDGSPIAGPQSVSLDGVTITTDIDAIWSSQYRFYKNSNTTISTNKGSIVSVVFTCTAAGTANYGPGNFTTETGEYSYEDKVGTWTGEASEFVLVAATGQVRATQIVVTIDEGKKLQYGEVVDGGVYGIVNLQSTGAKYYLESVDGELTVQDGESLTGDTQWAATAQFKAIELEDGRFAFQNVATGDYLAWRNHNGQGGNGNCGFNPEINELSSWTMALGTQFPDLTTYWFYVNNRSETNMNSGSLIIDNKGAWNACSGVEWKFNGNGPGYSNNFGFVACASEVDFTKVNVASVAEEASESIDADKWYLVKQHRGGVSPIYDNGGSVYRAKSDNVVAAGVDAAEVVDYLVRFVPAGEEDVYNIQFANGRYFADGSEASNSTPVTTTEEEPGLFNVKYILDTPGHFGIYAYDMGAVIDNNGLGNTVVYWGNGEISDKVDGNNDFKIYEVEFAAKTTAAADLKELIKEVEAVYAANNVVVEVGEGIITSTDQFYSEYTDEEEGSLDNLLDGDGSTFWHSTWHHGNNTPMHVHYLQVEFAEPISGDFELNMNRRVNNGGLCQNDNPVKMSVETSVDGEEFVLADEFDTPLTQTGAAPLVQAVFNIPTAAKYLRFFADECNGGNNRGYWHCGDFQIKPVVTPAPNAANAEAAAAFAEALSAAKEVGANATDADIAALQAAFAAYEAALAGTPAPVAVTFEFTDNEDGTITVTPSDLKAPYFFNIYSDRINTEYQLGTDAEALATDVAQNLTAPETEVHTGVSVVNPAEWINYWFGGYVQYTAGDYRLGVVALNWDGTYTMAGEPVFHAFTKAASEPVVDDTYVLNFEKDLVQKSDDRHVTGFKLNDQTLTFPSYNTVYLDATDQVLEVNAGEELVPSIIWDGAWMHGIVYVDLDNDGSFYEEGDLVAHSPYTGNQNLATSISAFNAPAKAGEYRMRIKTDWVGDSQNMDGGGLDPAGRIGDDGSMTGNNSIWANRGRIIDVTLKVVGEETFPAEGVAYKFKNVDSELYITLVDDPDQDVTLGATPDQMFFTAVEGGWTISNSKGIVLGATAKGWNIGNSSDPIVWTIEEVEGGYAFHNEKGYLGFDNAAAGMKAFRDKNYTTHHGVFNIWKYDEEEPEPVIPDATLDEIWENIHSLLAEAEAIKTLNQVTVTYDRDGYFEDFTSPIVGKLGYKGHDVVWAVCDGADYVQSFVSYFSTAAEAQEYLEEWGGLAALQEIIQNVIDDYNAAEVVLPEAGKTYIVYSDPYTYGKAGYSYVLGNCVPQSGKGYDGPSTIKYGDGSNITNAFVWTCEGRVAYERENEFFETELVDYRYKFTNVETGNYLTWKNQDMWYLSGAGAPYYGAIKMQVNADNNLYRWLVIDMRDGSLNQANGDCTGNTYSNWYYFEEFEPIVSEWDGSEPVVTVADATTVKVTFTDAHAVEASNYGVLAAIYDETGDVYAIAFNDLFGDTVEFGKDCATLHFKKISDLNAELAAVASAHASKVTAAVSGADVKGKVVIASKSFKIDETCIYNKVIISDFDFNAGGQPTGIEGIANDSNVKVYDLQGRRVAAPRQGFQIRNGVKVVK